MPLAADMAVFVANARARLAQAPRDVLAAISTDLVQNTPVDQGFLRAAWSPTDAPPIPKEPDPSGAEATNRLVAAAQALAHGGTLVVMNSMFYAPFVEYGTIHMTPRAYLRGTLARAPAIAAAVLARGGENGQP